MSGRLNRIIHGALVLTPVFAGILIFLFLFSPALTTYAKQYNNGQTDLVVGIDNIITIALPKRDISFIVDPTKQVVETETLEVGIYTNTSHGVYVGMSTPYSRETTHDDRANGLNSVRNSTIPALKETVHKALFPDNRWGYSLDGGTYYSPIPAASDGEQAVIGIKDSSESGIKQITIGAKVDASMPVDYYYNTINFTVITNIAAKTINDIFYLQEMDPDVADSMIVDHQYLLRDIRDNQEYWVAKFSNGDVWMTQDLNLVISKDTALTPDDTDIKKNWTSQTDYPELDYEKEQYNRYSIESVSGYRDEGLTSSGYIYGYSGGQINACRDYYQDNPKFCNHFFAGKNYSWLNAVAANQLTDVVSVVHDDVSVDQSICPKGWRLPTRSYNTDATKQHDFPTPVSKTIRQYDENGDIFLIATVGNSLLKEPYFMLNTNYLTSSVSASNSLTYFAPSSNTLYGSTSISGRVRCMARPTNRFTIEYDLNGGTGTVPQSQIGDSWYDEFTFQLNSISNRPYKEGYSFVGWSTDPDATRPMAVPANMLSTNTAKIYDISGKEATFNFTTSQKSNTLYAVWEPTITVRYDANGGNFSSSSINGETTSVHFMTYSPVQHGRIESSTTYYSSKNESGASKENINDNSRFPKDNTQYDLFYVDNYNSSYNKVEITIYYAVPGDSYLCIFDDAPYSAPSNCNNSLTGNLSQGAYYEASDRYLYKQTFTLTRNSARKAIFFKTNSINEYRSVNWYGFWAEVRGVNESTDIQYIRSQRTSMDTPSRSGYAFLGWGTEPNLDLPDWQAPSKYTANKTLYAIWKKYPTIRISFVSETPDKVQILTPTIEWNSSRALYIYANDDGDYYYYDYSTGSGVQMVFAKFTSSSDAFYKITTSIAPSNIASFSTSDTTRNYTEGQEFTVEIGYSEERISTMQELTRTACHAAPLGVSQQLEDSRDGSIYWIEKLADDHCWMTQNLDFYLTASTEGTVVDDNTLYIVTPWNITSDKTVNNYFDGGDYYLANGITPTPTTDLADDAQEWRYHRGSFYNYHAAKYMCPPGWSLGNYRDLYKRYNINQPSALYFTFDDMSPLQAPFYQILDHDDSVPKPDTGDSSHKTAVYWSQANEIVDTTRTTTNIVPLQMDYTDDGNGNMIFRAYSNRATYYRTAGFIRCSR